jgi:hypothetical protein
MASREDVTALRSAFKFSAKDDEEPSMGVNMLSARNIFLFQLLSIGLKSGAKRYG